MSAHATPDPHAASTVTSSTPDVKKSEVVKIIVIFALFIIVLMASTILYFSKSKGANNKVKTEIQGTGNISSSIPSHYTEYHTLKKGEVVRVNIPQGYKCDYYGGGKKYYHQAQNCDKEIWGGGSCPTGLGNPNASYADISVYEEEITVRCEFSIKK